MRKKSRQTRRSECPLNASVEMVGDRWSLLIVRDMMLSGARRFADFLNSHEAIATNILSARLRKLAADGIIAAKRDPADGRSRIYLLTEKGIALASVLTELVLWASSHERTGRQALVRRMRDDKDGFLAGIKQGWKQRGR